MMRPTKKEIDDFHELMGWPLIEFSETQIPDKKNIRVTLEGHYMLCDCYDDKHEAGINCATWVKNVRTKRSKEAEDRREAATKYLTLIGKKRVL